MTILTNGQKSYRLSCRAYLQDLDRDIAADSWAIPHIENNSAYKWILGKFVESDVPNSNKQTFALDDLRISKPTITHSPLNMVHQRNHIIGTFVASELIYDDQAEINTHIEALAVFWSAHFPEELKLIQAAHEQGSLWFSMECVSESVRFEDLASGETETFPYMGPTHESYGNWPKNVNAIKWLDKPHFLGGALILPPFAPGWKMARVKELSNLEEDEEIKSIYESVIKQSPDLTPEQAEGVAIGLLSIEINGNEQDITKSLIKNNTLPIEIPVSNSDEIASEFKPKGGENNMGEKTYSDEEFQAALAKALEPVNAELAALRAKADADAIETSLEELKVAKDAEIAKIREELDEKAISAQTSKEDYDQLVAWLEGKKTEADEAAVRTSRQESRLAAISEAVKFPDDYVSANTERWIAMTDEDFAILVEGYKVTAEIAKSANKDITKKFVKAETAMTTDRVKSPDNMDYMKSVMRLRREGIDPRLVN